MLTDDDLMEWRTHPVTERVMEALRKVGEARKAQTLEAYWRSGEANPRQLDRAQVFLALCDDLTEATADVINEWNEPERD
jgi:hypothetical protein